MTTAAPPPPRTDAARRARRARLWRGGCGSAGGLLVITIVVGLLLPGCSVGYVTRQSFSHMRVLAAREPVGKAVAEGRVPEAWRPALDTIEAAKTFGAAQVGLPTDDLYETISLVKPDPTWVVTAAARDALEPVTWWFPIVGRVAYRGYYDKADAEKFAAKLRADGFDVLLSPVDAFSTLGWFSDPIRPSMLDRDEADLANLVLHEAAHRVLYLKGQTDYNETFASFVGDEAALLYLAERHAPDCEPCRRVRDERLDAAGFEALVEEIAVRLTELYASDRTRDEKIRAREEIFAWGQTAYGERSWRTRLYAGFPTRPLDNAIILALRRYGSRRDLFDTLHERCGSDLRRSIAAIVGLGWADLPRAERRSTSPADQLAARLAGQPGCPDPPAAP